MKIVEVDKAERTANPHGVDSRKISDTEWAQVMHITLAPGESLKKHVAPVDVVFYVLEGRGIVEIGNEKMRSEPTPSWRARPKFPTAGRTRAAASSGS